MRKLFVIISIAVLALVGGGVFLWSYFYLPQKVRFYKMYESKTDYTLKDSGISSWMIVNNQNKKVIGKSWQIEIPMIDFSNNNLLLSSGRKMKELSYTRISQFKWQYNVPKGIPVYEDGFYPNTVFVYVIDRVLLKQAGD